MAGKGQPKISLFPFMSVLACTIGALMLLLVAMSISAVGSTDASASAYETTRRSVESDRRMIEEEKRELARAEALWAEVDEALVARGLAPGLSRSSLEREIESVERRATLTRSIDEIRKQLEELEEEEDSVETTISVLESRRTTLPILIDPTGLSSHFEPYFVECDAEGATAYRASDDFSYFVAKEDLSTSGNFGRYLRRVLATPGALLVLLVRPDGIATMNQTYRVATSAGIRVAKLPLPGKGKLDWSLLRRAEGGEG